MKDTKGSNNSDSELSALRIAIAEKLRGARILVFGNLSRQGAKAPSSKEEEKYSYELFSLYFPTFAALASLREIFRVSVAAVPR